MPSAMPRKSASDPSVTMSGGSDSIDTIDAVSAPPAAPTAIAPNTAAASGRCQECQSAPRQTAERPIIAPTDRTTPPAMSTGVIATASSPSSTLSLVISKKLPSVKKFGAVAENTATSRARAASRTPLCSSRYEVVGIGFGTTPEHIERDGDENDEALHSALPIRADPDERECRTDGAEEHDPEQRTQNRTATAGDGGPTNHNRRNHLHFQTQAGIRWNLIEPRRVEERGKTRHRTHEEKRDELHPARIDACQTRG